MSAELVEDPNAPQTVEDDLESFYWVLLWICLSYMDTNLEPGLRSSILNNTMNPRVYGGTGGCDKKNFIVNPTSLKNLEVDASPVMSKLIKSLHKRLGERYQSELSDSELLFPSSSTTSDTTSSAIQSAEQSKKAVNHEELLQILREALEKGPWGKDDGASPQDIIPSQDEASRFSSRSKRSHSTASRTSGLSVPPQAKRPEVV